MKIEIEINERTLQKIDGFRNYPKTKVSRGEAIAAIADLVQPLAVMVELQNRQKAKQD